MKNSFNIMKKLGQSILEDDCLGLASETAFNFLLSLFPFAIFLFAVLGVFGDENLIYQILELIKIVAPHEALDLIKEVLKSLFNTSSGGILTISFIGTIWTISNSIMSMMKALNRIYKIKETRAFWETRLTALLILFLSSAIIILGSYFVIFSGIILKFVNDTTLISDYLTKLILVIRWPISFLTLFLLVLLIYYFVPNLSKCRTFPQKLVNSIPGTLFFCIFWLISSGLFSLYVENFGKYNAIYGSLGAVIILLLWLYYTSLIILIGGEINSKIYDVQMECPEIEQKFYK